MLTGKRLRIFAAAAMFIISTTIAVAKPALGLDGQAQFNANNGGYWFKPGGECGTGSKPITGSASVPEYKNPVYNNSAPDPSVVQSKDGTYFVYATGGVLLKSKDLVNWQNVAGNWRLNGSPNEAGGSRWAPDVTKIGEKYVLTYTIPTGTKEYPAGGNPQIAYAIGDDAGGQFTYQGKLSLPYGYSIDSNIFVDEDGKIWLFWGGGVIHAVELTLNGNSLQTKGQAKELLGKDKVGSPNATIEGAWVVKRNGWYYLTYSQGRYDIKDGAPAYRVLVARSKTVNGSYEPNTSMRPILEGKAPILYPGHHSIATDASGNDWILYHGYFNGERNTRSLMLDRITFEGDWPVVNGGNGPSSSQQAAGSSTPASNTPQSSGVGCCTASTVQLISGGDGAEKAWNFFTSKGYSAQQAAGIIGNIKAESGVLPMRLQNTEQEVKTSSKDAESKSSGWGLVQWTPASKMITPAKQAGNSYEQIDTIEFQLQFLWEQLEGTGLGGEKLSEKGAGDDLKNQTTIDGAARSFMLKFERPADQSEAKQKDRAKLANEIFGLYGNGASASPTTISSSSSDCKATSGSGGDAVSIAQAELAKNIVENPLGCDSEGGASKNKPGSCGPEIDKYTDTMQEYWCADFVSWVYKEAGTPFTGGSSGGWRIPAVSSVEAWFKENGNWVMNGPGVVPKPGDVYTMGISHTGIVEKVEGNIVYTISGNTATDNTGNGNGVGRGQYPVGSGEIVGYGSIK